jgi:hypothetical protein
VNRRFKLDDARPYLATACLHWTLMLFHDIDALNDHPLFARQDSLNNPTSTPLIPGNHLNGIASFDSKHRHHTPN